jgi:hypothetical protein
MKTLSMASVVGAVLSKSMAFGVMLLAPTGVSGQGSVDYFAGFGSFEGGAFVSPLIPGVSNGVSSAIPGWVLTASGSRPAWLEDIRAQEGDRFIGLGSRGGSGPGSSSATFDFAISPTPFTAGELYELVFWAAGGVATSSRSSLTVAFNPGVGVGGGGIIDLPRYTQTEFDSFIELPWEEYRFTFTVGEFAPELRLSSQAANASGTASVYVDNFSIRPVPEPSGVLLVGVAVGVGLMMRRR